MALTWTNNTTFETFGMTKGLESTSRTLQNYSQGGTSSSFSRTQEIPRESLHDETIWEPLTPQSDQDIECRSYFKRYSKYMKWQESTQQKSKKNCYIEKSNIDEHSSVIHNDEEDHGYQSSESPLISDVPLSEEESTVDHENFDILEVNGHVHKKICNYRYSSPENQNLLGPCPSDNDGVKFSETPFLEKRIHDCSLCCTNGFFMMRPGPFSEFESNCSCTTHTLVDWQTRVTWTDSNLRHQLKVHEVTSKSPYRSSNAKRSNPKSIKRFLTEGYKYLDTRAEFQMLERPSQNILQQTNDMVHEGATHIPLEDKDHRTLKETEEKPHVCSHPGCGRTFYRNEELTRHTRIHTGQKPFLCNVCGRGFVRRDHLAKHQRTHLPAHAKRTYSCPLPACTHSYTRSDALTRHMWTAHHIRARQPSRPRAHTTASPETNQPYSQATTEDLKTPPEDSQGDHHQWSTLHEPLIPTATPPLVLPSAVSSTSTTQTMTIPYFTQAVSNLAPLQAFGSRHTAFRVVKGNKRTRSFNGPLPA